MKGIRIGVQAMAVLVFVVGLWWVRGGNGVWGRVLGFREVMEKPAKIELVAAGDVMLGRSVNEGMVRRKDWKYPFRETRELLVQGDITFGNLESPFGESCPPVDSGMVFCADERAISGLVWAGFDALSLENNHKLNQAKSGLDNTEEWVEENGVLGVREGEIEILERNGVRVAILATDDVSQRIDEEALGALIAKAKKLADVVVVSVHWGWEYNAVANARQERLGHLMVDNGADLVLGHHPHWVQNVEEYKNGWIVYSLGNFVFDQMWSEKTREGLVGVFELSKEGVEDYQFHKVKIYDYAQPRWEEWAGEVVIK